MTEVAERAGPVAAEAPARPRLLVTRMKDDQAALGVALHFLARRQPFAGFAAGQLVATVARQIRLKHHVMAFEGTQIAGYLGWELMGEAAAAEFARTLKPPPTRAGEGEEVVWVMLAGATSRRALRLMVQAGMRLYPGRRVMGVRHKPNGKVVIFNSRIAAAPR